MLADDLGHAMASSPTAGRDPDRRRQMAEPLRLLAGRYWQYRKRHRRGPVLAVSAERWPDWAAAPNRGSH